MYRERRRRVKITLVHFAWMFLVLAHENSYPAMAPWHPPKFPFATHPLHWRCARFPKPSLSLDWNFPSVSLILWSMGKSRKRSPAQLASQVTPGRRLSVLLVTAEWNVCGAHRTQVNSNLVGLGASTSSARIAAPERGGVRVGYYWLTRKYFQNNPWRRGRGGEVSVLQANDCIVTAISH